MGEGGGVWEFLGDRSSASGSLPCKHVLPRRVNGVTVQRWRGWVGMVVLFSPRRDTLSSAVIKRTRGASLMGVDGAISSGSSRKWSCSCHAGGLKPGLYRTLTHSINSQLSSLQIFLILKEKMASASWQTSETCSEMCLTHPPTHLVSSDLRPQALVKVYKELWGVSG